MLNFGCMADARRAYGLLMTEVDRRVSLDAQLETLAWEIFLKQTQKGSSFVDAANMAAVARYKLNGILSFDRHYPKELVIG